MSLLSLFKKEKSSEDLIKDHESDVIATVMPLLSEILNHFVDDVKITEERYSCHDLYEELNNKPAKIFLSPSYGQPINIVMSNEYREDRSRNYIYINFKRLYEYISSSLGIYTKSDSINSFINRHFENSKDVRIDIGVPKTAHREFSRSFKNLKNQIMKSKRKKELQDLNKSEKQMVSALSELIELIERNKK